MLSWRWKLTHVLSDCCNIAPPLVRPTVEKEDGNKESGGIDMLPNDVTKAFSVVSMT
jgi:hypothetical protein